MLHSVILEIRLEFLTGESCSIVSNDGLGQTKFGKQCLKFMDDGSG